MFAADYPFLDIFWTMIIFFAWVIYVWMMIAVLTDLFRRRDTSGWGEAAWTVFLILLPFLGVLIYLITNNDGMGDRNVQHPRVAHARSGDSVPTAAPNGGGAAGEIEKAKNLLDSGATDRPEFEAIKAKALA